MLILPGIGMDRELLIKLDSVSIKNDRGDKVFRDLKLLVEPGRSVVITGSSGSGKTLLIECLTGLRRIHSGSIVMFGKDISSGRKGAIRSIRRKIGGVGGAFGLVPSLSVSENIRMPMIISGERNKVQVDRLRKMLAEFSLIKRAGDFPSSLTRVEYSMVQYARASIGHQPLLIIDEPTAGLDSKSFRRVLDFLVKVAVSGRSMVVLTSEPIETKLPNTDYYQIANRALQ